MRSTPHSLKLMLVGPLAGNHGGNLLLCDGCPRAFHKELLHSPEKMAKAQKELEEVLGKDELVQESDISKLPYLRAIVKETLRLHPIAPLVAPHKAEIDKEVCGFTVPKNAEILVNVWAMGRDSSIWPNPDLFVPERFLEKDIDFKGGDFELIPFGAGRRICPGLPLANRMVHLMLASLSTTLVGIWETR